VALSIQFDRLAKVTNIHGGILWTLFREQYPNYEEHPPLTPAFEIFGPNPIVLPQVEFSTGVPDIRYWFVRENGSELLQFQPDRLIHNWRKRDLNDRYPRYEKIRDEFAREVRRFEEFIKSGDLGELKPNQCEVTYVNHIEMPDNSDPRSCPERVLSFWADHMPDSGLPTMEDVSVRLRYLIGDDGKHVGRLYAQVGPVLRRKDLKPLLQMSLTARGKPQSESIEAAFDFLDIGRRAIVRGFKALTKPEMHDVWGITK
jgi:uncharacterized protein (TIGR04255 family)